MARARSPDRDKAFELYKEHNGHIQIREIAKILDIPEKTVSGWKSKDKWDIKLNGVLQFNKRSTPKENTEHSKKKNNSKKTLQEQISEDDIEDVNLTEKQRLFCLYYIKSFNATQAAIKAGYAADSAHVEGSRLLRNPKVADEIKRLKGEIQEELFIDAMDVLKRYIKIAFSDITDYVKFGQKQQQVMGMYGPVYEGKGKDKKPVMETVNYVDLKDSNSIDGTLITEVSQGKDGIKIKLADKMKALEKLSEYFDLFPDKWKRQIEEEKLKLAARKAGEEDSEENADDGFLEALKGEISEVWEDEEV